MKIKLINPKIPQDPLYGSFGQYITLKKTGPLHKLISVLGLDFIDNYGKVLFQPLNLAILAALTPREIEIEIIDERVKEVDYEQAADLVGISAMTANSCRAYEIAAEFRKRGSKTVLGGYHPSLCPAEALQYADSIVVGEAEKIWPELIKDFLSNRLKRTYRCKNLIDPKDIPLPRYDILNRDDYHIFSTQTTRGCPFNCSFCAVTNFFGRTYRQRPIENVIREVMMLKEITPDLGTGRPILLFADDNIVGNPTYSKELFKALIPLKIYWVSQCTITIGNDLELLRLAAESGCLSIFIGYESLSQDVLKEANKSINRPEDYFRLTQNIRSHGIAVYGSFIFGFESDSKATIDRTLEFAFKANIDHVYFTALNLYPGTPLFEKFKKENKLIVNEWWTKENYQTYLDNDFYIIKHPTLKGREIFKANKVFYSPLRILKRIVKTRTRLWKIIIPLNLKNYFTIRRWEKTLKDKSRRSPAPADG